LCGDKFIEVGVGEHAALVANAGAHIDVAQPASVDMLLQRLYRDADPLGGLGQGAQAIRRRHARLAPAITNKIIQPISRVGFEPVGPLRLGAQLFEPVWLPQQFGGIFTHNLRSLFGSGFRSLTPGPRLSVSSMNSMPAW
jgi:hypothetical protein